MPRDDKKFLPINYTHREFESIRSDLMQMAERFYPDTFQDFSEASFGAMMLDAVAYVGDQLSLYLDYNVNESFLDTAFEVDNIIRHGRVLGYKPTGRPSTFGDVAMYIQIPASTTGMGPDMAYVPLISRGSSFTSANGLSFVLTENVSFADPSNETVVAEVDSISGAPTHYAIKAYGMVVSGRYQEERISVGAFERFKKIKLNAQNVSEIISVFDAEGNEYFEVDYLSQDMVFKEFTNKNYKNDNVPSILKPYIVSRKFVLERGLRDIYLQFGSGDASSSNVVAKPQDVAMQVFGKNYITNTTFDPTRLSKNKNFGICPAQTTLTVTYRTTNPTNSNVAVGALNQVSNAYTSFEDRTALSNGKLNTVLRSVEVSNETPIVGDISEPTATEIKRRVFDTFPTQNRAVTQADYESIALRMPAKFGSLKRVSMQQDPDSLKRNLNLYVISEDSYGFLTKSNSVMKNNLKTWLNQYRMMNDTIDILDPYIINIGVDFVVKPTPGENKVDTLNACLDALFKYFEGGYFIGEPVSIGDIYAELKKVTGVLDVMKVQINNKVGGQYSSVTFNARKNLSPDGGSLLAPRNAVFELKYPSVDLKGKIR